MGIIHAIVHIARAGRCRKVAGLEEEQYQAATWGHGLQKHANPSPDHCYASILMYVTPDKSGLNFTDVGRNKTNIDATKKMKIELVCLIELDIIVI